MIQIADREFAAHLDKLKKGGNVMASILDEILVVEIPAVVATAQEAVIEMLLNIHLAGLQILNEPQSRGY